MSTRRERKKANREAKRAAEAAAEARARRIRTIRNIVIFAVFIVVLLFLMSCSSDSDDGTEGATASTIEGTDVDPSEPPEWGTTPCPPSEGSGERQIDFEDSFENCLEDGVAYTAVFETTHGRIEVELDTEGHPVTANNFIALARSGYYDDTDLFRTEAQTGIIQGGAPHTQDNTDPGPGYTIADEGPLATSADYAPGTLAMARTADPHSASAQFFFLANEGGDYLGDPAQVGPGAGTYRVFGKTVEGLDVLETIAALDDGSRTPSEPVAIESVTITES